MLAIITISEMLAITISQNASNYNFPKCQQLWFSKMLAIRIVRNETIIIAVADN
jgi:hypothetical protein